MRLTEQEIFALAEEEKATKEYRDRVAKECAEKCLDIRRKLAGHLKAIRTEKHVSLEKMGHFLGNGKGKVSVFEEPSSLRSCSAGAYLEVIKNYGRALEMMSDSGVLDNPSGPGRPARTPGELVAKYPQVVSAIQAGVRPATLCEHFNLSYNTVRKIRIAFDTINNSQPE